MSLFVPINSVLITPENVRRNIIAIKWTAIIVVNICKKLISLKHCVRSQITRLKMQKSFCDLEHGASL